MPEERPPAPVVDDPRIDIRIAHLEEDVREIRVSARTIEGRLGNLEQSVARLDGRVEQMDKRITEGFASIDKRMSEMASGIDRRFGEMDKRFTERTSTQKWGFGLIIALLGGILAKLWLP